MINFFRELFKFFFYGNIYIGLLAGALTWANSVLFGYVNFHLVLFMFFSATLVYNLDRLISFSSDFKNTPRRSRYIDKNLVLILLLILGCLAGILFLLKNFDFVYIIGLSALFCFTVLYLLVYNKELVFLRHFLGGGEKSAGHAAAFQNYTSYNAKISFLKPVLLGLVWAATTVILPVVHSGGKIAAGVAGLFGIRLVEYAVNGVLFDYRDISGDFENKKNNLFLAKEPGKIFKSILVLLAVQGAFIVACVFFRVLPPVIFSDLLVSLAYILWIWNIVKNKACQENLKNFKPVPIPPLAYSLVVDGVLFLPAVFVLLQ